MTAEQIYNMLVRKGVTATARVYASASFDPATNLTTPGSATDQSVKIIPPYRHREGYNATELITSGRGFTGVANHGLTITISAGLILIIDSKTWTVTGIQEIKDSTGILLYLLEIESGS